MPRFNSKVLLLIVTVLLAIFLFDKPVKAIHILIPTPPKPPHFNFIIPKPPKPPRSPCPPFRNCNPTLIPTLTPTITPSPTSNPLPAGAISWWQAEGNANDSIDSDNGTLINGVTFSLGKIGQAFSFNGDNYFQTDTTGFPTGNSDRTIELWVKINSFLDDAPVPSDPLESFFVGYGTFISSFYALGTAGNVLYFSAGPAIFGPSLKTDTWYHVAVTNVGNNVTLYLNGNSVASGTIALDTPAGTHFYIGRIPGSIGDIRRLHGLIDEVVIYNRALTPSEIHARANP